MTTITRLRLTPDQLQAVCTTALNDWVEAVVEVFRLLGIDLTDPDQPSIRPGDYALPRTQWEHIAEACGAGPTNVIGKVNHMLDWMNYGPGAYPDEEAP